MYTMHLLPSVAAIQSNLELKTRPKQLLGSLPLVIALPGYCLRLYPLGVEDATNGAKNNTYKVAQRNMSRALLVCQFS
jgi:hypothetical protein